VNKLLNIAWFC